MKSALRFCKIFANVVCSQFRILLAQVTAYVHGERKSSASIKEWDDVCARCSRVMRASRCTCEFPATCDL